MSWQAMGAVQVHSQYREDGPDNFAPFRILMALAWFANEAGIIGQAGDHRKCPGHRAIADRAGVHRNTVATWIPKLLKAGEVEIVASGGGGRGSWTQYRLLLPMESDVPFQPEMTQNTGEDVPFELVPFLQEMAQDIKRMAQQIDLMAQQLERMAQQNGTNGTRGPEVALPDPYDPISPDPTDPGGGESPPPPHEPADSYETAVWTAADDLVQRWCDRRGIYSRPQSSDEQARAAYFAPAVRIVHEHDGDGEAAWEAVWLAYQGMLSAGYTPKRLAPVVEQALGEMHRAAAPARASPNGAAKSSAADALKEYKRMKQEFVSHG